MRRGSAIGIRSIEERRCHSATAVDAERRPDD